MSATKRIRRSSVTKRRPVQRRTKSSFLNFVVPMLLLAVLIVGIVYIAFVGVQSIAASSFFLVRRVEIYGTQRASKAEINKIALQIADKEGTFGADLSAIKDRVEKLSFVKFAAVSRVLPDGIRVDVQEHLPAAIVSTTRGEFWADAETNLVTAVGKHDERLPLVIKGWDESGAPDSLKANKERLKIYAELIEDAKTNQYASVLDSVNLMDSRFPVVSVKDSGMLCAVRVPQKEACKKLASALKNISGRGAEIESIDVTGASPTIGYRKNEVLK